MRQIKWLPPQHFARGRGGRCQLMCSLQQLPLLIRLLLLLLLFPLTDSDGSCRFLTLLREIIAGTSRGSSARNHLPSAFSAKVVFRLLFFFVNKKNFIVLCTQLEATYALCSWVGVFVNIINVFFSLRIPQRKCPQLHLSSQHCSATCGNFVFCRRRLRFFFFFFLQFS